MINAVHPLAELEAPRQFVENIFPVYAFFLSPLPGNPTPCFATTPGIRSDQHANNWAIVQIDRVCPNGGCYIFVYNPVVPAGTGQAGWCCSRTPRGNEVYNGVPEFGGSAGAMTVEAFLANLQQEVEGRALTSAVPKACT